MYNYEYVTKNEALGVKKELIEIIKKVQNEVREYFTFSFSFIGSSSRNMITQDIKSNIGYDFDINIEVNIDENNDPKEIRNIVKNALNKVVRQYGYDNAEDSTRVLTIKKISRKNKTIKHSCDFAIIYNYKGNQKYIRLNKANNTYSWEYQPKGFINIEQKADWLKENGFWQELRNYYLIKKNNNQNKDKKSRSLYAEAINEMASKKGYK